jgi:ribosome-associated translation inhibitor RaiA
VQDRLRFAFSRITGRVRRILVTLADINGPRGGIDKRCLIEVRVDGQRSVVIQDIQADLYTAIDRAAGRAARSVMRRLSLNLRRRRLSRRAYPASTAG